jgi:hypothetical protein
VLLALRSRIPYLTAAAADHREDPVGLIAARQIRQAETALSKRPHQRTSVRTCRGGRTSAITSLVLDEHR